MKTKRCKLVLVRKMAIDRNGPVLVVSSTKNAEGVPVVNVRFNYGGRSHDLNYITDMYGVDKSNPDMKEYQVYLIDPNPCNPYEYGDRIMYHGDGYRSAIFMSKGSTHNSARVDDEDKKYGEVDIVRIPVGRILADTTNRGLSLSPSCVEKFYETSSFELDVLVNFNDDDTPVVNKKGWIPVKAIPSSINTEDIPMNDIKDILSNPYVSMDLNLKQQVSNVHKFLNLYNYLIK